MHKTRGTVTGQGILGRRRGSHSTAPAGIPKSPNRALGNEPCTPAHVPHSTNLPGKHPRGVGNKSERRGPLGFPIPPALPATRPPTPHCARVGGGGRAISALRRRGGLRHVRTVARGPAPLARRGGTAIRPCTRGPLEGAARCRRIGTKTQPLHTERAEPSRRSPAKKEPPDPKEG